MCYILQFVFGVCTADPRSRTLVEAVARPCSKRESRPPVYILT